MAAGLGYSAVQLDATHPQARPRSLDRSARRDLAAVLRRHGLAVTGLDLWIPPEHLTAGPELERATEAVVAAIGLTRELAGLVPTRAVVALALPPDADAEAMEAIKAASRRHEVAMADHAWPPPKAGTLGLDPANAITAGKSAAKLATELGSRLASARLSDVGVAGRVPVGSPGGSLDVAAYAAALSIAAANIPVVADVRLLADLRSAATTALRAWREATEPFEAWEARP